MQQRIDDLAAPPAGPEAPPVREALERAAHREPTAGLPGLDGANGPNGRREETR
ncbi:hypothetical protein ACTPOK_33710 [Streptomyces inhibens]|uniref:hypothetical protein n=1 Tax=Streptomyces inhibens TaxID=2293571 RepID=UPI00402AA528